MALDPRLVRAEKAMRDGFASVIDSDGDALVAAFRGVPEAETILAVDLARRVIVEAMKDAEPSGWTDDDLASLGRDVAETESWANLDPARVATYLLELNRGQVPTTDAADTFFLSIVVGGYLVSGTGPEDRPWSDYLDKLLDRIITE